MAMWRLNLIEIDIVFNRLGLEKGPEQLKQIMELNKTFCEDENERRKRSPSTRSCKNILNEDSTLEMIQLKRHHDYTLPDARKALKKYYSAVDGSFLTETLKEEALVTLTEELSVVLITQKGT
uniref:Uncharacterized protein n=1 Tax=Ditylenchus dipsaci TaxID=166011 RepID=A0A915DRT1_9BILA